MVNWSFLQEKIFLRFRASRFLLLSMTLFYLPKLVRVASLTLVQSCDCPIITDVTHYIDVKRPRWRLKSPEFAIVYSSVYSGADQRKHQSSASLVFVRGIHRDREFPAQRASNAENVSIWWRHHAWRIWATSTSTRWQNTRCDPCANSLRCNIVFHHNTSITESYGLIIYPKDMISRSLYTPCMVLQC